MREGSVNNDKWEREDRKGGRKIKGNVQHYEFLTAFTPQVTRVPPSRTRAEPSAVDTDPVIIIIKITSCYVREFS